MLKAELVKENERLQAVEREHHWLKSNNIAQAKRREGQFEGFRGMVTDLQDDKKRLEDKLEGLEKRFESLAKQDIRIGRERDDLKEENSGLKGEIKVLGDAIEVRDAMYNDLLQKFLVCKGELYDKDKDMHNAWAEVKALEEINNSLVNP